MVQKSGFELENDRKAKETLKPEAGDCKEHRSMLRTELAKQDGLNKMHPRKFARIGLPRKIYVLVKAEVQVNLKKLP